MHRHYLLSREDVGRFVLPVDAHGHAGQRG
jgi:hypothetical protein